MPFDTWYMSKLVKKCYLYMVVTHFVLTESEQMYCIKGNTASSFNFCFSKDTHSLPYKLKVYCKFRLLRGKDYFYFSPSTDFERGKTTKQVWKKMDYKGAIQWENSLWVGGRTRGGGLTQQNPPVLIALPALPSSAPPCFSSSSSLFPALCPAQTAAVS